MKRLAAIVAVGLLVTVFVAGAFWLKIRDERAQAAQLEARVAGLEALPPPAPPAPPPPPQPVPAPAMKPALAAPAPATAPPKPPTAAPSGKDVLAQAKQMLEGDTGRNLVRMVLLQQYPDLAKELGLSEAEAGKLLDLLARQQLDLSAETLGMLGGAPTDPNAMRDMARKVDEKTRAHEAELSALLGSKHSSWQQYQATSVARQQLTRLASALGSANALSESQNKAVLASLATAQAKTNAEQRNQPAMKGNNSREILENQIKQAQESMDRLLEAASPHLNITQTEIYKNMLQQDITMASSMLRMMGSAQ